MRTSGVVFDLDGTITDLYSVPGWLPMLQNKNAAPYMIAKPIGDAHAINARIAALKAFGVSVEVVSWLAKNNTDKAYDAAVRRAKKAWLRKHFPAIEIKNVHIVKHGTNKWSVAHNKSAILLDDELNNCRTWNKHTNRGKAIHVTSTQDVINTLDSLLEEVFKNAKQAA